MTQVDWVDYETTGLDANKHDLLEVAVAIADSEDPFNATLVHQAVFWFHPDLVKGLDPDVREMHTKNGLLKECAREGALDPFESEDALLKLIPEASDKPILAGSSVHFDWEFMKARMPRLAKRMSHRTGDVRRYDVSVLKLECKMQGMPDLEKAGAHRAKDDVFESIAHAKVCREWMRGKC